MEFKRVLLSKKFLPFAILASGVLVFAVLKNTAPSSPILPAKERSWLVDAISVTPQQFAPTVTLYGQIETPSLLNAAAPDKSRVTQVAAYEGDKIISGQILLRLDERDFKPRLQQAKAKAAELEALIASEQLRFRNDKTAIAQEKSILELQQSAVKRAQKLQMQKLGSTASLEQAQEALNRQHLAYDNRKLAVQDHEARLQQLQARLANAKAEVDLTELNLERSQIVAPFDGYIETLSVAEGDHVKEGQVLMTLYSSSSLELRAKIPAAFQHEIQQAIIENQSLSATAKYAGKDITLQLSRLSGKADSRGIDALFLLTEGNDWVRPGASMIVQLQRPIQDKLIALPHSAIYDNNRVFRVIDQRLQSVSVENIGDIIKGKESLVLVRSDKIKAGDYIITTQLPGAISGLKVTIR
jgi:multidrug efflux pump subunit AcrA (membrane-fusion protein)